MATEESTIEPAPSATVKEAMEEKKGAVEAEEEEAKGTSEAADNVQDNAEVRRCRLTSG